MNHKFSTPSKKALMIIALSFFAINNSVFAQYKGFKINKMMQLYHDYGQFNGTVLVADDRKVIFKKGYGLANMEWNIANEPNTKFRLGSITKQFTSMIIMQLVKEGKIQLDGKISNYLPGYHYRIVLQIHQPYMGYGLHL